MNRREWLATATVAAAGAIFPSALAAQAQRSQQRTQRPELVVYKDPDCGCCTLWVDHARAHGFQVRTFDTRDLRGVKTNLGVPGDLSSCHTTLVGRYVVEGHVPAELIDRLLAEKPRVAGIAVAGMPVGSPGMEVPGRRPQAYEVIAFSADGKRSVFARR